MTQIPLARVREVLRVAATKRVMVVGDVMLDRYLWGSVSRISPEAPVPVVDVVEETTRLGGAANVANNVVSLGAVCHLVGVVGDDHAGLDLAARIGEKGIAPDNLVRDPTRPTTVKTRVIAHNQQVVRADREAKHEVAGETAEALRQLVMSHLEACDAVILSDYGKGLITKPLLDELIPAARAAGKFVTVDPKDAQFRNYKRVSLITPNLQEAGGLVSRRITNEESLLAVGWEIFDLLQPDALLVTRGERGMSLFQPGRAYSHFPTAARHVYDVTGAGDTVISSFTLALAAGATMAEAAEIANHAAGLVIREVGTATVRAADLEAAFGAGQASPGPGGRARGA